MEADFTLNIRAGDDTRVRVETSPTGDGRVVVLDDTGRAVICGTAEAVSGWAYAIGDRAGSIALVDQLDNDGRLWPERRRPVDRVASREESLAYIGSAKALLRLVGDPDPDLTVALVGPATATSDAIARIREPDEVHHGFYGGPR